MTHRRYTLIGKEIRTWKQQITSSNPNRNRFALDAMISFVLAIVPSGEKLKKGEMQMTDREKFMEVVRLYGKKTYEVAADLGMSPQSLYNKLGNATQFTQAEIARFRDLFPEVDTKTFEQIFFAQEKAVHANE